MTERILIIDQVATNRIVLKVRLARENYDVMLAENGHDALRILRKQGADLVICAPDCGDMTAQKLPACQFRSRARQRARTYSGSRGRWLHRHRCSAYGR